MDVKRMHCMIEKLSECAKEEFEKGIECVDTDEMGKVTDMLKDLAEAMYYRTLTNSMEESEPEEVLAMFDRYGDRRFYDHYRYADGRFAPKGHGSYRRGYEEHPYWHMTPEMYRDMSPEYLRDMDLDYDRMYYSGKGAYPRPAGLEMGNAKHFYGGDSDMMRDSREGKAGAYRKAYMESKELHKGNTQQDKEAKMKDLDTYMKELGEDVLELVHDMTPEEKTLLKTKMTTLVTKL